MSNIDRDRDLPLNQTDNLRDRVEDEARLTLSEEELAVRKERHLAGEVEIGKHVETQHVSQQVPVSREEVTIERRPLTFPAWGPMRALDGIFVRGRVDFLKLARCDSDLARRASDHRPIVAEVRLHAHHHVSHPEPKPPSPRP